MSRRSSPPPVDCAALPHRLQRKAPEPMNDCLLTCNDYVTTVFSRDFVAEGFSDDGLERIHCGEIGDWVRALALSGLFPSYAVAYAAHAWRRNPRALLDALLGDADEVTVKRYDAAWRALSDTANSRSTAAVNG